VSWDLREGTGAIPVATIAAAVATLSPDVIALQGLTAEEQAFELGDRLKGDWSQGRLAR
jgi:hypothetical protein